MMKKIIALLAVLLLLPALHAVDIGNATLEKLENTGQCLGNCESWLELDLTKVVADIQVSSQQSALFKLEFLKRWGTEDNLLNWGMEVWKENRYTITDYCPMSRDYLLPTKDLNITDTCAKIGCADSGLNCICQRQEQQACGFHIERRTEYSGDFFGYKFQAGEKYRIKIWGKKKPTIEPGGIDWVPTFLGVKIKQWAWWDTDWEKKAPIDLPAQNINRYETIQVHFENIDAQADLDDVRIVDENNNTELDRACYGNDTDGNCYFRMPYGMLSGDAGIDSTYYLYYDNDAAASPSRGNSVDTNACGWEADEYCRFSTANGAVSSLEAKEGSISYKHEGTVNIRTSYGLAARSGDLNYSTWLFVAKTPSTANTFYLNSSGAATKCEISLRVDGKFYVKPDNTLTDTGITYDLNTWYNIHISYQDTAITCTFTVYKADGSIVLTRKENIFWPVGGPGAAVDNVLFDSGAADLSFTDNFFMDVPLLATGLGSEEAAPDTTAPVTTIGDYNNVWQNITANVQFTCADAVGCRNLYYKVDDTNYQTDISGGSAIVAISADNNHSLYYFSDDAGDNNETVQFVYIAIDKTAPVTTDNDFNNTWQNQDANIQFSCSDNNARCKNLYYSVNDVNYLQTWGIGDQNIGIVLTADLNHKIWYWSDDNTIGTGDNNESPALRYLAIDKTAPTLASYYPIADITIFDSPVDFQGEISDAFSGAAGMWYGIYLNGVLDSNGFQDANASGFAPVSYSNMAVAGDAAFMVITVTTDNADNNTLSIQKTGSYFYSVIYSVDPRNITEEELENAGMYFIYTTMVNIGAVALPLIIVIVGLIFFFAILGMVIYR